MAVNSGLAVVTMLGNAGGIGPGHTALVVGSDTYSFEDWAFWQAPSDAWMFFNTRQYLLQMNRTRPAIVQELTRSVQFKPIATYLVESIQAGDQYAADGVCSSQVAAALVRGTGPEFRPRGIVTPREVYLMLQRSGLVSRSYYYWPDEPSSLTLPGVPPPKWVITERLRREYPGIVRAPDDGVVSWSKISLPAPEAPAAPPPEAAQAPRAEWLTGVQYRLRYLKLYTGPVSGVHDVASRDAVKAFQRAQRIAVDGIPGPITQGKLVAACGF
ncbi:peptidoglycan-binding domain-containing protein [Viridibacterium curvum]|uniref:Peptidoglycan binding-like domain-containing protein n=1 Tax=Viridibacterium curvum TaxID=1101404 RepID=A0ABP9QQY1_9RHOO